MSKKTTKKQSSKLAKANMKLSRMIAKYYQVDFDIISIRKELKISDSIFSYQTSTSRYSKLNEVMN